MNNKEILEVYKDYCRKKDWKQPMIPTIYDEEQTLGEIFSNLEGQSFRAGVKQGNEESY